MTTYNTQNPLGSTDPRDLYDNAENLDNFVNGAQPAYDDRLGQARKSWAGMESEFNSFMESSGYVGTGADGAIEDYAAGIDITAYNQIIRDGGELWRVSAGTDLPYTTTGAGMPEGGAFVSVGDAALRQELAGDPASGLGAALVNGAVQRVSSRAEMKAQDAPAGYQFSLAEGGRSGLFVVKAGTPPVTDPQEGIYVVLDNGDYAERVFKSCVDARWFGVSPTNSSSANTQLIGDALSVFEPIRIDEDVPVNLTPESIYGVRRKLYGKGGLIVNGSILSLPRDPAFYEIKHLSEARFGEDTLVFSRAIVDGDFVYATVKGTFALTGQAHFVIIDITDPYNLRVLSKTPIDDVGSQVRDLVKIGNTVYAFPFSGGRIHRVDVTNKASPSFSFAYIEGYNRGHVINVGGRIIVAEMTGAIRSYYINSAGGLEKGPSISLPGDIRDPLYHNGVLWVPSYNDGTAPNLYALRIKSNGDFEVISSTTLPDFKYVRDMSASGSYLYAGGYGGDSRLCSVDISDPSSPTQVSVAPGSELTCSVYGEYLVGSNRVWDLADPENPMLLKDLPSNVSRYHFIKGRHLFCFVDGDGSPGPDPRDGNYNPGLACYDIGGTTFTGINASSVYASKYEGRDLDLSGDIRVSGGIASEGSIFSAGSLTASSGMASLGSQTLSFDKSALIHTRTEGDIKSPKKVANIHTFYGGTNQICIKITYNLVLVASGTSNHAEGFGQVVYTGSYRTSPILSFFDGLNFADVIPLMTGNTTDNLRPNFSLQLTDAGGMSLDLLVDNPNTITDSILNCSIEIFSRHPISVHCY